MTASTRSPSWPERRRARGLAAIAAVTVITASLLGVVGPPRGAHALAQSHPVRHFQQTFVDASRQVCRGGTCGLRVLDTRFTAPDDTGGPYPLVLFAHGFAVDPADYQVLLDRVAAAGYVVAAPLLPESAATGTGAPIRLYTANQAADLSFLLTQLTGLATGDPGWAATATPTNPIVMGHSDGGIIAGALVSTNLADPRFAGAVVIAGEVDPAVGPYGPHGGRVLVVHGDADTIAPFASDLALSTASNPPKAFLVGVGRSHSGVVLDPDAEPARDAIVGWLDWVARFDASGLGRFAAASTQPGWYRYADAGIDLSPIGGLEGATGTPTGPGTGTVTATGWALDPDTTGPIAVDIAVDGTVATSVAADLPRADVGAVFKDGDGHGFSATVAAGAGDHQVCATAHNVGGGSDRPLGCRTATVALLPPDQAPAGLTAQPFAGSAVVRWTPLSPVVGVQRYVVTCSCGVTASVGGGSAAAALTGLPDGVPVTVTVRAENGAGPGPPSPPVAVTATDVAAGLRPVTPERVLDTRSTAPLGPREVRHAALAPPAGAVAGLIAVTGVGPAQETYLTVGPTGTATLEVSSLNLRPGLGPVSNQLVVPLGVDGGVDVYNNSGTVDVVLDLMGWLVTDADAPRVALVPARVADTRQPGATALGPQEERAIHVVAAGTAAAVGIVLTSTRASAPSFLTAWAEGPRPFTSVQNPMPGLDRAADLVVPVDPQGDIHLYNNSGSVDVIVDLLAVFPIGSGAGPRYHPSAPRRLYDSRDTDGPLVPDVPRAVSGVAATVQANVVATETTTFGHVTAWEVGPWPGTSNLNFAPGITVAQQVAAGGPGGLTVQTSGSCQVVIDTSGTWR